jgi:hypothetical protein
VLLSTKRWNAKAGINPVSLSQIIRLVDSIQRVHNLAPNTDADTEKKIGKKSLYRVRQVNFLFYMNILNVFVNVVKGCYSPPMLFYSFSYLE